MATGREAAGVGSAEWCRAINAEVACFERWPSAKIISMGRIRALTAVTRFESDRQ
jgi:hypothetical protein